MKNREGRLRNNRQGADRRVRADGFHDRGGGREHFVFRRDRTEGNRQDVPPLPGCQLAVAEAATCVETNDAISGTKPISAASKTMLFIIWSRMIKNSMPTKVHIATDTSTRMKAMVPGVLDVRIAVLLLIVFVMMLAPFSF